MQLRKITIHTTISRLNAQILIEKKLASRKIFGLSFFIGKKFAHISAVENVETVENNFAFSTAIFHRKNRTITPFIAIVENVENNFLLKIFRDFIFSHTPFELNSMCV